MEAVQKPALVQRIVENVCVRNMLRTNFVLKLCKNLNNYYRPKPNRLYLIFFYYSYWSFPYQIYDKHTDNSSAIKIIVQISIIFSRSILDF